MVLDPGLCYCGNPYSKYFVQFVIKKENNDLTLDDVPQGYCPICKSSVYTVDVIERIQSILREKRINVSLD